MGYRDQDVTTMPRRSRRGTFMERKMLATCRYCGSTDITKDASVRWCDYNKVWDLVVVYDHGECHACGETSNDLVRWVGQNGEEV